ncbi:MAG TPA: glycosyltransferase [Candidatus Saccharimonadales bacterium]|jgi:glycosyltransferase involved in cell wall biosynthesis|nr:glycosyltransferase [Candidatus Saccharimonadales bacterium]
MRKIRALHVHSGNLFGGIETYLVTLAKLGYLCPGMESEFALCFGGRLSEELAAHSAKIHWLGRVQTRYPWTVKRARNVLAELLRLEDYDAVVCHSAWPQAIFGSVVQRARIPHVFYLHDAVAGRHWLEVWAKRVVPDYVICNSRYTREGLVKMYPGIRSEVLYFPVMAPNLFGVQHRTAVRVELQTAADAIVIIQVSRMETWKGHTLLLEASARLGRNHDWIIWIVGGAQRPQEERYCDDLKEKALRLGIADRVRFAGERVDIARLLAASDIFCQPNLSPEPFGISLVEALGAGLPVITSAMGGALEIVDDSCGILVRAGDAEALAAALRRLLLDRGLRKILARQAPARAHDLCAPEQQMKAFERVLSSVIGRESEAAFDRHYA